MGSGFARGQLECQDHLKVFKSKSWVKMGQPAAENQQLSFPGGFHHSQHMLQRCVLQAFQTSVSYKPGLYTKQVEKIFDETFTKFQTQNNSTCMCKIIVDNLLQLLFNLQHITTFFHIFSTFNGFKRL